MIIQQSTTDKLILNLSLAADLEVQVSGVDLDQTSTPPGEFEDTYRKNTDVTAIGDTDITAVTGAANIRRNIKYIAIVNIDTVDAPLIKLKHTDGTIIVECMPRVTLQPGESAIYNDGTWFFFDVNGGVKMGASAASDTVAGLIEIATQAEQETATDILRAVTPGRQQFHPSACKAWIKANGAGTSNLASYNISSIADTGTGRLGVNINVDMSSANYAIVATLERTVTALTETGVEDYAIRNASPAVGAFEIESYDHTPTTFVAQDPANYFAACFGDQ